MNLSRAEVIVVGNEILAGKRVDTNSAFIGETLSKIGVEIIFKTTVRDDGKELGEALQRAIGRSPLVITSGGLGPTLDDLTRKVISDATGIPLRLDGELLDRVKRMFSTRGLRFAKTNESQALVPEKGCYFPNPNGTAPGLVFEAEGFVVVALPGPPRELCPIVTDHLAPYLLDNDASLTPREERVYQITGTGESNIDEELRTFFSDKDPIAYSSIPHLGRITFTFTLLEDTLAARERFLDVCRTFEERFSKLIYGGKDDTLESVVGRLLREQGKTIATAESCTGGLIGGRITDVSGSSDYYVGSVVAYSNRIKTDVLGVPKEMLDTFGAVSEQVAAAMASGVCSFLGSDYGLSTTGIAGPTGGTTEKPVGLVYIGLDGPNGVRVERRSFFGKRDAVRERTVVAALDMLRRALDTE